MMTSGMPAGRKTELATVRGLLSSARDGPAALLITGDAGIGKTTLWSAGLREAAAASFTVLACRAIDAEASFAFAGLSDLLDPVLETALPALPPPQRRALEVALLRTDDGGAPVNRRGVAAALLSTLRMLASSGPVLVAIDDVPWLDEPSRSVVGFALRRLKAEPVGALVTIRTGALATGEFVDVEAWFPPGAVQQLRLGPLSLSALRSVLADAGFSVPRSVLSTVWEATEGNPFFALEMLRGPGGGAAVGVPPPIGSTVEQLVRERIEMAPPDERLVLVVAAACRRPTRSLVARVVRECGADGGALERAIDGGLLIAEGAGLRFVHPLFAAGAYAAATGSERREVHASLATAVDDVEERARHLALASPEPDEIVAAELDAAASVAAARGAPEAAVELVQLAIDLTPPDRVAERGGRYLRQGGLLREVGDPSACQAALERAAELLPAGSDRASAYVLLGYQAYGEAPRDAFEHFERARREALGDPDVLCDVEQGLSLVEYSASKALAHARKAMTYAERGTDPVMLSEAIGNLAIHESMMGRGVRFDLFEGRAGRAGEPPPDHPRTMHGSSWLLGDLLFWNEELDRAREVFEEEVRSSIEWGDLARRRELLGRLFLLDVLQGDWPGAEARVAETLEVASWLGNASVGHAMADAALLASLRGDAEEMQTNLEEARRLFDMAGGARSRKIETAWPAGLFELSLGNGPRAVELLATADDPWSDGYREPSCALYVPDWIEALIMSGETVEAERLLRPYEARSRRLDRSRARSAALRCRGSLAASRGDLAAARRALARSEREHERHRQPFELARTLLVRGEVERRDKRKADASRSLARAEEIFERLGAKTWSERARAERARVGGRPAAPAELTETERRVAELVVAGRTNREVADSLFLSVRTVEGNLTRIYRKLGVRSRTELAARWS